MMFDFEKLQVYLKAEETYTLLNNKVFKLKIDKDIKSQIKRACSSILLNIAEGTGKFSKNDKKYFYNIARGSTFECVAILRILKIGGFVNEDNFGLFHNKLEEIGKMLSGLINSMK